MLLVVVKVQGSKKKEVRACVRMRWRRTGGSGSRATRWARARTRASEGEDETGQGWWDGYGAKKRPLCIDGSN